MKREIITIQLPLFEEVFYEVEALEEYAPIEGNLVKTDNPKLDKKIEKETYNNLNNGNQWAWCTVRVKAMWRGLEESDYLSCCSHDSKQDFIKNSGHYEDMQRNAYNSLIQLIKSLA